nr:MAG TPA: hypothetical protein [Caudoviricetes sp.]
MPHILRVWERCRFVLINEIEVLLIACVTNGIFIHLTTLFFSQYFLLIPQRDMRRERFDTAS